MENSNDYFMSFEQLLLKAEEERLGITPEVMGTFGLEILDEFTCGIFPHDLVVIGADSGMGKSELAYMISEANAKKNKKVCLFALEGNLSEMAWRYTQREMIQNGIRVMTSEYRVNTNPEHHDFVKEIYGNVGNEGWGENISIFNKSVEPTIEFIEKTMNVTKDLYDMYVIDHLHYLDYHSKSSENEQISKVMRTLQRLTGELKKPVILVGHVRKRNLEKDPTKYDLHGSSNIPKEATTIVMISRMDIMDNEKFVDEFKLGTTIDKMRYAGTKMIIDKSRAGMGDPIKLALIYDRLEKRYLQEYSCLIRDESSFNDFGF